MALAQPARGTRRARTRAAEAAGAAGRLAARRPWLLPAVLGAAFIGISAWWTTQDTGVPTFDAGFHLQRAFAMRDMVADAHLGAIFETYEGYPPLVHLVGGVAAAIAGVSETTVVLVNNLVFLPLLLGGIYAAGSLAFDRRVGAWAAVVALASPMVISQFHEYMLDAPQAALVAVGVALLLWSDRFTRRLPSLLAGVAISLALLTKPTSAVWFVGIVAVMLVRGGWRRPAGLALCFGAVALIAGPWYLDHVNDLRSHAGVVDDPDYWWYDHIPYAERWTVQNFAWYGWNLVNNQLYLPLLLAFLAGLAVSVRRFARERSPSDVTPELVAGGAVGWVCQSLVTVDDGRYTLPALVYIAVFAAAWIPSASRRVRTVGLAAILLALVANTAVVSFGATEKEIRLAPFGGPDSPIHERRVTVLAPYELSVNEPDRETRFLPMLEAAARDGARLFADVPRDNYIFFNGNGITAMVATSPLKFAKNNHPRNLGPRDLFVAPYPRDRADVPPCGRLPDGWALYAVRGPTPIRKVHEYPRDRLYCPLPPLRE
jgi:4-amino-4-deoxy-L-arabinose transferase-like glycosyltransferase